MMHNSHVNTAGTEIFCDHLMQYFQFQPDQIIHIAGPDGSGRSSMVKTILTYYLAHTSNNCFILDTDQKYSTKSFKALGHDQTRIFISKLPNNSRSFPTTLQYLLSDQSPVKSGDLIVINAMSSILKRVQVQCDSYADYHRFVHIIIKQLFPKLIRIIAKKNCRLLFVHHVSYKPDADATLPYFYDLMLILKGMWIFLDPQFLPPKTFQFSSPSKRLTLTYSWQDEEVEKYLNYKEQYTYLLAEGYLRIVKKITQKIK
jgi:hypothetical protein